MFPPGRRLAAAHGHLLRQASELGPQAPIVDRPADVEHHTPEQLWVEIGGGKDISPARQAARELDELGSLAGAERRRRADRDAHAPELVELVRRLTGRREVLATTEVDPELLGGVVLDIDGTVYDGSLRAQLVRLGKQMAEGRA